MDNDFVLIDFNNAADKFAYGVLKSFIGKKASEMYSDRLDIIDDLTKCMQTRARVSKQMDYLFQYSKENKFLSVNYDFLNPDLIIVRTEDITERRKAENKLKESELKFRNMIYNLDV